VLVLVSSVEALKFAPMGRRPSHGEMGYPGVAPCPRGSDARTIRVGGWGGLRRHVLRPSCTLTERVPTVG